MITTVKITRIHRKVVETQYGAKDKVGIQTDKHGDKWLSCFVNKSNEYQLKKLQEGEKATIVVEQSGEWLNFRIPDKTDLLEERVTALEQAVFATAANKAKASAEPGISTYDYPENDLEEPRF